MILAQKFEYAFKEQGTSIRKCSLILSTRNEILFVLLCGLTMPGVCLDCLLLVFSLGMGEMVECLQWF